MREKSLKRLINNNKINIILIVIFLIFKCDYLFLLNKILKTIYISYLNKTKIFKKPQTNKNIK